MAEPDALKLFTSLTDKELLALVLYGEARGEPPLGKLAVAHVVMNRAARPCWWGKSIKEVILKPQQFSCFNPDDPNYAKLAQMARTCVYDPACLVVASLVLDGFTKDPTEGSTHYCTVDVSPSWAEKLTFVKRINKHRFYRQEA